MKRKGFIKSLFLGSAGALVSGQVFSTEPKKQHKNRLMVDFIAGFQHYDGPDAEPLLEVGMPLQLNREPHNHFEKNAIEIWTGDAKLGYVPRSVNSTIADLMDKGSMVEAIVLELCPSAFPNGSVKVEVFYMYDNE